MNLRILEVIKNIVSFFCQAKLENCPRLFPQSPDSGASRQYPFFFMPHGVVETLIDQCFFFFLRAPRCCAGPTINSPPGAPSRVTVCHVSCRLCFSASSPSHTRSLTLFASYYISPCSPFCYHPLSVWLALPIVPRPCLSVPVSTGSKTL